MQVQIKLNTKHEVYQREKQSIDILLKGKDISYRQITGVADWKTSIFSVKELNNVALIKVIGEMESVTEMFFGKK